MSSLTLDIPTEGLDQLVRDLAATEKEVRLALRSTLSKMSRWLNTRGARGLAKELAVPQKVVRGRMRRFRIRKRGEDEMGVWFGLNPISLAALKPRQTRQGVTAGRHRRAGAFIAQGQVFKRRGRGRLPIEKQTLDVQDKADTFIEDELLGTAEFEAQFLKTFEHELQWRMRKRKST